MNLEGGANCIVHSCIVLSHLLCECPIPASEQRWVGEARSARPTWEHPLGIGMSKRYKRPAFLLTTFRARVAGSDPVKPRPRAAYAAKCKAKLRILCLSQKTIPR
jgi:hypothetical protein